MYTLCNHIMHSYYMSHGHMTTTWTQDSAKDDPWCLPPFLEPHVQRSLKELPTREI